jgi:hypothetical protein
MLAVKARSWLPLTLAVLLSVQLSALAYAQEGEPPEQKEANEAPNGPTTASPLHHAKKTQKRKYMVEGGNRSDAGVFHVAAAAGGNFYIEPQLDPDTGLANGTFFKDFGFQAGIFFDYDYSEIDANIPLMLRGMVGYKYVLSSTHVFAFDGVVRRQFRFSEKASFGLGLGGSAAVWYRSVTTTSPLEEIVVLPSFVLEAGFDFNPFMVDFKWLVNRIGSDSTLMGFELYFGFRL